MKRRSEVVPVAVAAGIVAVALLGSTLNSKPRLSATNTRVAHSLNGVVYTAGQEKCQAGEHVPADARRLRMFTGSDTGELSPILVRVTRADEKEVFRVRIPPSGVVGPQAIQAPVPPHAEVELGRICIRNLGPHDISLAGNFHSVNPADPGRSNLPPFQPQFDDVTRVDWFLSGNRTLAEMAPRIADRSTLFRPGFQGAWTPWAALLALLGAAAFAGRRLWRLMGDAV